LWLPLPLLNDLCFMAGFPLQLTECPTSRKISIIVGVSADHILHANLLIGALRNECYTLIDSDNSLSPTWFAMEGFPLARDAWLTAI
jgi:hypothetical protein